MVEHLGIFRNKYQLVPIIVHVSYFQNQSVLFKFDLLSTILGWAEDHHRTGCALGDLLHQVDPSPNGTSGVWHISTTPEAAFFFCSISFPLGE